MVRIHAFTNFSKVNGGGARDSIQHQFAPINSLLTSKQTPRLHIGNNNVEYKPKRKGIVFPSCMKLGQSQVFKGLHSGKDTLESCLSTANKRFSGTSHPVSTRWKHLIGHSYKMIKPDKTSLQQKMSTAKLLGIAITS